MDSAYHVYAVKYSNGKTPVIAEDLAKRIKFNVSQNDSILYLPKGFAITRNDKFRNQQVRVIVEVPVNKRIKIDRNTDQYKWFNINTNGRRGWNRDWDDRFENGLFYNTNVDYLMTDGGLESIEREREKRRERMKEDENGVNINRDQPGGKYRYPNKNKKDSLDKKKADSLKTLIGFQLIDEPQDEKKELANSDSPTPIRNLLMVFQ
jgi:hypothetical protein